ncbi:MAG: gas vesicle protein [Sphingomonadales bacterium]|nr:gas vesicle protein [Sphingomonadales bacterium]
MAESNPPGDSPRAARPKSGNGKPSTTSIIEAAVSRAEAQPPPVRRRPVQLIEEAKRQLKELTGYPVESVSEFGRTESGWRLVVTVIELNRIPAATDVLAEYIVGLDEAGDIVDYRRGRRYFRDQVGEPE